MRVWSRRQCAGAGDPDPDPPTPIDEGVFYPDTRSIDSEAEGRVGYIYCQLRFQIRWIFVVVFHLL
eukprot:COSAG02_NODE_4019_length_5896_cov_75.960152_3_plen_66_part_00